MWRRGHSGRLRLSADAVQCTAGRKGYGGAMRTLVERARRRVAGSAPGQSAARALSRARLRTFQTDDESMAGLLTALRTPSEGEEQWSAEIEAARGQLEGSEDVVSLPVTDRAWWERAIA